MKAMNNEQTGHYLSDMVLAGTSLVLMLFGWIDIETMLRIVATVVSIGAGSMVFYNNYKQSRKNNKPK